MNPILEAALYRDEFTRRNAVQLRIPRLFWYLRSRRARWLRQCFNALLWMALAAWLVLTLNACTNANSAADSSPTIALHRQRVLACAFSRAAATFVEAIRYKGQEITAHTSPGDNACNFPA